MHVNTINNKRYIGITCQTPENRWRSDGSGYARSSHFWNAIQKYGWDNFKHIIVLQNETFEYACSVEKCLIKHYKTKDPKYGYNLTDGGEGMCGWSPSDEWRRKQSENKKGIPLTEETKRKISDWQQSHPQEKAKLVRCKETGEIFNSINEAQRKLHIYHIGDNCRGKLKSAGGLHF